MRRLFLPHVHVELFIRCWFEGEDANSSELLALETEFLQRLVGIDLTQNLCDMTLQTIKVSLWDIVITILDVSS